MMDEDAPQPCLKWGTPVSKETGDPAADGAAFMGMIHADGTDCGHTGQPKATVHDEGGPVCAGGQPVTHVRVNGNMVTVAEAVSAFQGMADALAVHITPLVTGLAEYCQRIGAVLTPTGRVLAAAATAAADERSGRRSAMPTMAEIEEGFPERLAAFREALGVAGGNQ